MSTSPPPPFPHLGPNFDVLPMATLHDKHVVAKDSFMTRTSPEEICALQAYETWTTRHTLLFCSYKSPTVVDSQKIQ